MKGAAARLRVMLHFKVELTDNQRLDEDPKCSIFPTLVEYKTPLRYRIVFFLRFLTIGYYN